MPDRIRELRSLKAPRIDRCTTEVRKMKSSLRDLGIHLAGASQADASVAQDTFASYTKEVESLMAEAAELRARPGRVLNTSLCPYAETKASLYTE